MDFDEDRTADLTDDAKEAGSFDWDELYRRLGEPTLEETEARKDSQMKLMAEACAAVIAWLTAPVANVQIQPTKQLEMVGRRVMALVWVIESASVPGECAELSLTKFSARFRLHKGAMSELTAEFTKKFGVRNKAQLHGVRIEDRE